MLVNPRSVSRSQLSRDLHISFPAVTDIVNRLKNEGLVVEEGKGTGFRGRKPILLKLNEKYGLCAFVEISYEEATMKFLDLTGNMVSKNVITFDRDIEFNKLLEIIMSRLLETFSHFLSKGYENLLGISFSIPAPIDHETNTLVWSRYYGWRNIKLPSKIPCCNRKVNLIWENDSNMIAYGASQYFGGVKNLVAFYFGIGIGAGIVIDGKVHRGYRGLAGEIGQVLIPFRGKLYELERVISEESTIKFAQSRFPNLDARTVEDILRFLERHSEEKLVEKELQKISRTVAQFLSVLVIGLDPQVVIFDGEIVRYLPTLLRMVVDNIAKLTKREHSIFRVAAEEADFSLYGAYRLTVERWFDLDVVKKLSER